MDEIGCVNIFLAEGAGVDDIVADSRRGRTVPPRPFGHVQIDTINPGRTSPTVRRGDRRQKKMVQKSGYFSRSAAAGPEDLALIRQMAELAVACGLTRTPA